MKTPNCYLFLCIVYAKYEVRKLSTININTNENTYMPKSYEKTQGKAK